VVITPDRQVEVSQVKAIQEDIDDYIENSQVAGAGRRTGGRTDSDCRNPTSTRTSSFTMILRGWTRCCWM
jgi:hypothetical protein